VHRTIWKTLACAAFTTLGTLAIATPAHAAPTVTLRCEDTYRYWDCMATPSGTMGSLRWYIGGQLDSAFNDNTYWNRPCAPYSQITVTVVYTDPSGAQASRTKTPLCYPFATP
jgi:hypothetical protein